MTGSDFLLNMKSIPTKDSIEHDAFWKEESHKVEYGLTVDNVYIPGWLYWHTQLWNIYVDEEDPVNNITKRKFKHPSWRDNEWIIADAYEQARKEKKGVMIFGSRRLGKSEYLSSHIGMHATIFEGSENIITGGNWGDIDIIMYKLTQGLNHLPDYFKFGRLTENLRKEIELGFKAKRGNTRISWSKIIARNHEEGNNTEVLAGLTATSFAMDEVGKSRFAEVFEAVKPAFTSPYGWRCSPVLTGTSGDMGKSLDAQKFFEHPESQNFIFRELKEEGNKRVGVFIDGRRRMEGKYETTLGEYIKTEKGILIPKNSELNSIPFLNSDLKKAEAVIDAEREAASKSPDPKALLKVTMYYPKNTKELFLSDDGNNFPVDAILEHIEYLKANEQLQGVPVKLYRDIDGKVRVSYNTKKNPLVDYPFDRNTDKDGAIVIYEPPEENIPPYLYISGADPYNQSSSKWSESVGSIYIYKRIHDPIAGTFQRRIVASYTGRPQHLKEWHENVEMLLELYNATCLPENEASTFIQYFDQRGKAYMLADGYNFLLEISPKTSVRNRPKGLPAIPKVQQYYKELVYRYCTEEVVVGQDEEGKNIVKLGVYRIADIGLLRELAAYNDKGNFDRYVAFGHTLAHEAWADKIYPFVLKKEPKKEESQYIDRVNKNVVHSPFHLGKEFSPFSLNNNPFNLKIGR